VPVTRRLVKRTRHRSASYRQAEVELLQAPVERQVRTAGVLRGSNRIIASLATLHCFQLKPGLTFHFGQQIDGAWRNSGLQAVPLSLHHAPASSSGAIVSKTAHLVRRTGSEVKP
jgi:hypothetical protein